MIQPSNPPSNIITFEVIGPVPEHYIWSERDWPDRVKVSGSIEVAYAMLNALLDSPDLNVEVVKISEDKPLIITMAQDDNLDDYPFCRCGQRMKLSAQIPGETIGSYMCLVGEGCGRSVLIHPKTGEETWWKRDLP